MYSNKSRNNKLFDVEKSTSTFMNLMSKYRKRKRNMKDNDKCYIAKAIDEKRFELEKEEKDDQYIYKEAKNSSHIDQELINIYGTKAKNQVYDISKFQSPIKLGKKQFFDPTKENTLQTCYSLKLYKKGFLKLPLISQQYYKYNNKPLLTYSNSNNLNKISSSNNILNTDYSIDSNKKTIFNSPIKRNIDSSIETERNLSPISLSNNNNDINNLLTEITKNKTINKNRLLVNRNKKNYFSDKNIFSNNGSYLISLSNFKEQLINEEKKQRNYFDRNDYGCNLFKEKYNFLSKKYFSTD